MCGKRHRGAHLCWHQLLWPLLQPLRCVSTDSVLTVRISCLTVCVACLQALRSSEVTLGRGGYSAGDVHAMYMS
jgi:hypothetical protein